jgi:glutamate synthase domain-containing protein 1
MTGRFARSYDDGFLKLGKSIKPCLTTKKAFYEFNSCIMEPWDGPASIPFTDGNVIEHC